MIHRRIVPLLVLATLAACADTGGRVEDRPEERAYVTGSNIPRKNPGPSGVTTVSKEDAERLREDLSRAATPTAPAR